MREYDFYQKNTKKSVIALGFFDAVHVGHAKVLKTCVRLAKKLDSTPVAFTFLDNLSAFGKGDKLVSTYDERVSKFAQIGIEEVLVAPCNSEFFSIEANRFLIKLKDDFNAVGIVCGEDFTFGAGGSGNITLLNSFCSRYGISLEIVDVIMQNGAKIGTREVKTYLKDGKIIEANELLGYNYSIDGVVLKGRGDGKRYGVPTLNIDFPTTKIVPKVGVYATNVIIDGLKYHAITNVGNHPTFDDDSANIETYVIDFDSDVYGKCVKIEFLTYLREVIKFDNVDQLKSQILKDVQTARCL